MKTFVFRPIFPYFSQINPPKTDGHLVKNSWKTPPKIPNQVPTRSQPSHHPRLPAAAHGALGAFHGAAVQAHGVRGLGLRHAARGRVVEASRRLGAMGGPWGRGIEVKNQQKTVKKHGKTMGNHWKIM